MNLTLKSKAAYTDETVQHVWENIEAHVTADEAEDATVAALAELNQHLPTRASRDRAVYGWSGGKDSLALQALMQRAGIHRSLAGIIPRLEFRTYLQWCEEHKPDGVQVYTSPLDLHWLASNPRYLFPRTSRDGYHYTLHSARQAQHRYQDEHKPDLQIFGRRTQDGNVCGDERGIMTTSRLTAYNPIRSWPHELVLAVIHYAGLQLPPTYRWPHGWTAGTGSWPGRRVGTPQESWDETYSIEPDRVREAADAGVPGAHDTLARHR